MSLVVPDVDPQVGQLIWFSLVTSLSLYFQNLKLFASLINHQNYDPEQHHQSIGQYWYYYKVLLNFMFNKLYLVDDNLSELLQLLGINSFSTGSEQMKSFEKQQREREIDAYKITTETLSNNDDNVCLEQEFRNLNLEKVSRSSLSMYVTNNSDADIFLTDDESFFETPQTSNTNLNLPENIHTNSLNINETVFEECQESFNTDRDDGDNNNETSKSPENLSCSTIEAEVEREELEEQETSLDNVDRSSLIIANKSRSYQEDNQENNVHCKTPENTQKVVSESISPTEEKVKDEQEGKQCENERQEANILQEKEISKEGDVRCRFESEDAKEENEKSLTISPTTKIDMRGDRSNSREIQCEANPDNELSEIVKDMVSASTSTTEVEDEDDDEGEEEECEGEEEDYEDEDFEEEESEDEEGESSSDSSWQAESEHSDDEDEVEEVSERTKKQKMKAMSNMSQVQASADLSVMEKNSLSFYMSEEGPIQLTVRYCI